MNDGVIDSNLSNDDSLSLTTEIRAYLAETAKWGKFLAIIGFVFVGLMVIVGLFAGSMMGAALASMPPELGPGAAGLGMLSGSAFTIFYLLIAALYFFPFLYLYRFASRMKVALASNDNHFLTESFKNLKSLYKFMGVFMIVILAFYVLMIVLGMFAGMFAMM